MLPAMSVAFAVKLCAAVQSGIAVAKLHAAAAVGRRSPEQGRTVIDLHRAAGLRRARQDKRIVVGEHRHRLPRYRSRTT